MLHGNEGARGARGHTNICTNICIYFGILFNNFSLCPFSKYTNTRRGAQTHTRAHTHKHTRTDWSFLCAYVQREGGGGSVCVCCIFTICISFAFSRCLARSLYTVESNRIELSDNVVLSGATQTTQWARSGLEKSSRVRRRWKTQTCCLGRTISHHQISECVCSESAREEVQKRAIETERGRENVSCNWNMLLESEKPTLRKGITLSNFSLWLGEKRENRRESERVEACSIICLDILLLFAVGSHANRRWNFLTSSISFILVEPQHPFHLLLLPTPCPCLGAPYLCNILYFHEFPPPTQPHISVCLSGFFLFSSCFI